MNHVSKITRIGGYTGVATGLQIEPGTQIVILAADMPALRHVWKAISLEPLDEKGCFNCVLVGQPKQIIIPESIPSTPSIQ